MNITFGIVRTRGTRRAWANRYPRAFDLGLNVIRGLLGFYFWAEVRA